MALKTPFPATPSGSDISRLRVVVGNVYSFRDHLRLHPHQQGHSGRRPGDGPESQALRLRQAGVESANIFRDIGVSGSIGTRERKGWHRLNERLVGGDTLVVVRIDRVGCNWLDTTECMLALRRPGVKIKSLDGSDGGSGDVAPVRRRGAGGQPECAPEGAGSQNTSTLSTSEGSPTWPTWPRSRGMALT